MGNLWRLIPADRGDIAPQVIAYPGAWHNVALSAYWTTDGSSNLVVQEMVNAHALEGAVLTDRKSVV